MKRKYRVLIADESRYLIQVKFTYIPIWFNCDGGKTYPYLDHAWHQINRKRNRIVWQED